MKKIKTILFFASLLLTCFWNNNLNAQACNLDVTPPVAICDQLASVSGLPGQDVKIPAIVFNDGSFDDCTTDDSLQFFVTLDQTLTAPPTTDTLIIPEGTNDTLTAVMWVVDLAGNANMCLIEVRVRSMQTISGKVFADENQNCLLDVDENGVEGFSLQYTLDQGATYNTINTLSEGEFFSAIWSQTNATEISIEVLLTNGLSTSCVSSYTFPFPFSDGTEMVDFPIQLASDCDKLTVDISSINLRRCTTTVYQVSYCNLSTYDIDNGEITLTLPDDLSISSTNNTYTDLGNNTFLFELDNIPSGTCDQFPITMFLDCNTPLGATRCVEAEITPHTCNNPFTWTGSDLIVEGECDELNGEVRFTITNQSTEPMQSQRIATVVEDVIMYMTAPVQLGPGASDQYAYPANGSTWRMEIPQENGHPSLSNPSATIEGCGGYGSTGIVNLFSTPDVDPFLSIDCSAVIGAYDPNDKQAFPIGLHSEHFMEPNTSIEYKIRFQNTGNDTAFVVRIEDRLSSYLDWTSVQGGASSHPYRMELKEDGLLIFNFENILLPDSTTNLEASQGFVKFRVHQLVDNALGTVIENTADIYFDINEAVVTNTVFHTLGLNFITTSTINTIAPDLDLTVAPNPFSDFTIFTLKGKNVEAGQFELYDITGRLIQQHSFSNNQFRLQRNGLPGGAYFFRLKNTKGILANGKLLMN